MPSHVPPRASFDGVPNHVIQFRTTLRKRIRNEFEGVTNKSLQPIRFQFRMPFAKRTVKEHNGARARTTSRCSSVSSIAEEFFPQKLQLRGEQRAGDAMTGATVDRSRAELQPAEGIRTAEDHFRPLSFQH